MAEARREETCVRIRREEMQALKTVIEEEPDREAVATYLVQNPHLLLATPFFTDYSVRIHDYSSLAREVGASKLNWFAFWSRGESFAFFRSPGGSWLWLPPQEQGVASRPQSTLDFYKYEYLTHQATSDPNFGLLWTERYIGSTLSYNDLLRYVEEATQQPVDQARTLISPQLWTPENQRMEQLHLWNATREILIALREERLDLRAIHWRHLEDLIAEVLRSQGMEVHVVRERPQGGRDIIARGELIPGEPMTLAVEVKQRDVVGAPELHKALHQNRFFPALLFATAGRFTAGVLEEAARPDNQLRLFLKDGVALTDMIRQYALRNGLPPPPALPIA